ncbi:hypothetical protein ACOMHN_057312 [Nucella lapillus]
MIINRINLAFSLLLCAIEKEEGGGDEEEGERGGAEEEEDAYGPVRSMLVTALCLHALCIGVGALCSCEDPDNLLGASRHMPRMEETLALLAGILIAGSLGLFAQISQQHPVYCTFHFDWSFWLMLAYLFLLLLAGGVILLLRNKCACRKRCTCHYVIPH